MAALAGAITALSFKQWREMSTPEILMALAVGTSFAVFVAPWIAHNSLNVSESDARAVAGMTYIFGAGSNTLLPLLINWVKRFLGQGDAK
ncbi:hypothetical protein [Sphingomonas sp.]|uniref:hypothetical protein n=1 Tax=Sphingomonas sp. TaxID=28214 RepID=UPI003B3AE22B